MKAIVMKALWKLRLSGPGSRAGVIEPVSAVAIVGMVVMMGAMMGFMIWGMPKMMGMMHGDHEKKEHEAKGEHRPEESAQKAVDPVCGMEVEVTDKTPSVTLEGRTYYFCSEEDMRKFVESPEKYRKEE
ncbi:MAG: YHS domain-containing protein [Nitrospirae bacterium]|nr:YHS domain-containing protein [Nitrospirota bacterium]